MSARVHGARFLWAAVWLVTTSIASRARAEPPLTLAWQAPAECPSAQNVTRAVEKLITKSPARTLEATATIRRQGERWAAEIRTPRGKRRLDGESCRAVAEAVAMVLALAIDPDASPSAVAFAEFDEPASTEPKPEASAPPPEPAPEPTPEPVSPRTDRAPPVTKKERARDGDSARFLAGVFGLAEIGMLPQATLGASADTGIGMNAWSAQVGAMMLLPRRGELADDSSRGGEIGYMGGYASACLTPFQPRRLDFCGAFEVGRLAGKGDGVTKELDAEALWLAPRLFAAGRLPLFGGFQGEARLGVALALNRPTFVLDDLGDVHQPSLLSFRGELGFSFR